jgi:hypothetical protein
MYLHEERNRYAIVEGSAGNYPASFVTAGKIHKYRHDGMNWRKNNVLGYRNTLRLPYWCVPNSPKEILNIIRNIENKKPLRNR